MCRIMYAPDPSMLAEKDYADLFSYLEKGMGGDGNGLATIINGRIALFKGVSLDVKVLARIASSTDGPVLFHTRRATTGGICDALCQPFMYNGTALVHNGIWRGWDGPAMELILQGTLDGNAPINDSLVAAALAANYGRYTLEAIDTGVFVVMTAEGAWLHLRSGTFKYCEEMGVYASDFPRSWPVPRSLGDDAIAFLGEDGPTFECGGWWTGRSFLYTGHVFGLDDDDDEELLVERLLREENIQ